MGTVAAEHRGHEVALAGSVNRLAGGDGSIDAATVAALRDLDADSGVADVAMTRWEGATTWAGHGVLVASAAAVLVLLALRSLWMQGARGWFSPLRHRAE